MVYKSFEKEFEWKQYFIVCENVIRQKEHSEIEFKESFQSPKHKDKKLHKWIASFANANGGLIIYGVKNNGELIGLQNNKLREFDNKDLSQELLDYFAPEIKFELFTKEVEGFELGFLYVYKSNDKPVVAIKSASETIQESDIFYRYPGQSRRISYGDLRNMIEEKYQKLNEKWIKLMNNIATIGVENVGLLNIENGELIGEKNKLLIPEELLQKVKFINEGKFVEKDGAPTLKLIGDVQPIESTKVIQLVERKYTIITHFELFKSFFKQDLDKETGKEFFRKVAYENTVYYPIYYYLVSSNLNEDSIGKLLQKEKGAKCEELKKRLKNERNNFSRFEIGNIKSETDAAKSISSSFDLLKSKSDISIKELSVSELRYLIQAITHLGENEIELRYILNILNEIYDNHSLVSIKKC
ncbi:MAG TPA: hypothetical protein DDY04_07205 [Bacteroidales bacterium]|nr:hypothetical protein [Bacteroidales bacterium]